MDMAEGYLCDTCIAALRGSNKINNSKDYYKYDRRTFTNYHHQKYHNLAVSKDEYCFICTWLWNKTPILPDSDSSMIDGFRIYSSFYSIHLEFHVVCPWAVDFNLKVSVFSTTAPSLPPILTLLDARPWAHLDEHIGSSQSLQKLKAWLSACQEDHEHCLSSGFSRGIFFPSRIIDVDDADEGIVYLRERAEVKPSTLGGESKPGDYPAYWTLSHRWGDPDLIQQLSQTTEDQFRSGMVLSSLSPTFRDAALLVRRMGFRYLWIDSLCIFQDSLSEWQKEAKAMIDIYRHSFCNISAVAASSDPSSTGLFSKRSLPSRQLFPFIIGDQHLEDGTSIDVGPWLLYNDSSWNDEIENTPLNTRGWVVQERFLAPRVLHFTKDQMYWECLETTVCEADPDWKLQILAKDDHLRQPIQTVYKAAERQIVRRVSNLQTNQEFGSIALEKTYHTLWGSLVSIYANCALTKESDRLIAMSGIAKRFQEASKDTYLAGLWKEVIHSDLTWKTNAIEGAEVVRNESYAPTWSWASVVGGHTTLSALHQRYSGLPQPLVSLIEERIIAEPPGGDPTGLLRSAELDIECMLFYYRWASPSTTLAVYKDDIRSDCYFEEEFSSQSLQLDTTELVQKFKELGQVEGVCVPLCAGYYGYGGGRNVFMMLDLVSGTTFRRIGTFEHGGIGKWIGEWSESRSRITLV